MSVISNDLLRITKDYLSYYFKSQSKYWIHSPFVYEFMIEVVLGKPTQIGNDIEKYRKKLLRNPNQIEILDLGAGYNNKGIRNIKKSVREILF